MTRVPRSVSGACRPARCSPWSAAFPPPLRRAIAPLCSAGFIGTTPRSDSSTAVHAGLWLSPSPAGLLLVAQAPLRSPGSRAWSFSACLGSLTAQGPMVDSRFSARQRVAFPCQTQVGDPDWFFEAQYPARLCPCLRFDRTSRSPPQDSGSGWIRYSFPVGLFHSLQHAGLSRRTVCPTFIPVG